MAATIGVVVWVPVGHLAFGLTVTQLAIGVTGGLIVSPNQALTPADAPPGSAGLASGFLQVSQRISATITMAAVGGAVLAASGVVPGLLICVGMLALATAAAAADGLRKPVTGAAPITALAET